MWDLRVSKKTEARIKSPVSKSPTEDALLVLNPWALRKSITLEALAFRCRQVAWALPYCGGFRWAPPDLEPGLVAWFLVLAGIGCLSSPGDWCWESRGWEAGIRLRGCCGSDWWELKGRKGKADASPRPGPGVAARWGRGARTFLLYQGSAVVARSFQLPFLPWVGVQ